MPKLELSTSQGVPDREEVAKLSPSLRTSLGYADELANSPAMVNDKNLLIRKMKNPIA